MFCHRHSGFSLVELAIVLAIIGILVTAVLKGQSMIRSAQVQDTIAIAKDLSSASQAFKQRFHYLPGDFPLDAEIPNVSANCLRTGANNGNGNGLIDNNESLCVAEHLIRAGFINGDPTQVIQSRYGIVSVSSVAGSLTLAARPAAVFAPSILNLIEFSNLPCDVAQEIDRKLDDGDLANGKIQASNAACVDGQFVVLALPL